MLVGGTKATPAICHHDDDAFWPAHKALINGENVGLVVWYCPVIMLNNMYLHCAGSY